MARLTSIMSIMAFVLSGGIPSRQVSVPQDAVRLQKPLQRRNGKRGRTQEDQPHPLLFPLPGFLLLADPPANFSVLSAHRLIPPALEALPLRWSAATGTQHRDVVLALSDPAGANVLTSWTVTPFRDADGAVIGAVAVGRRVTPAATLLPEDWLAVAAHDLRNPVTAVLGRLQLARIRSAALVLSHGAAAQQLDMHLEVAERNMEDLIRVMDTVLDASAAARGTLIHHLEPEGVDITVLARQAAEHAQLQTSRHTITLSAPPESIVVAGDRIRLRQVLDNLLANAIKYSPEGGEIGVQIDAPAAPTVALPASDSTSEIQADVTTGWVSVHVADSGLGIPKAAVAHVFERYWRVADAAHQIRGTGLGLYVCRAIVAAHGGHIWVERSVSVDDAAAASGGWHGTVVALVLPRTDAHEAADAPSKLDEGGQIGATDTQVSLH